jgi:RHS repeat-associated protein
MTTSAGNFYYQHDPLGSTSDVTNSTGAAQWAYSYEPYGAARSTTNVSGSAPENRLQFDSQYLDSEISQYDLRAREYDPTSGRFGALDPQMQPSEEPALNSYRYANGNPLVWDDPTGRAIPLDYGDSNISSSGGGSNGAHPGAPVWGAGQLNGYRSLQQASDDHAPGLSGVYGDLSGPSTLSQAVTLCEFFTLPLVFVAPEELGVEALVEREAAEEGGTALFHGTDLASAGRLLEGEPLSAARAAETHIEGDPGFYLATHEGDAEFFAARREPGGVIQYGLSPRAVSALQDEGAVFRPIPGGPSSASFAGREFFVPSRAFGPFNSLREAGEIVVRPR